VDDEGEPMRSVSGVNGSLRTEINGYLSKPVTTPKTDIIYAIHKSQVFKGSQ
jgi:hypothetical protein